MSEPVLFPELKVMLEAGDSRVRYVLENAKVQTEPFWNEGDPKTRHILYVSGILRSHELVPSPTAPVAVEPPPDPPPTGPEEQSSGMYDLYEKFKGCTACALSQHRRSVVFGSGDDIAPKMLVLGEAPGPEEERMGVPFIGPTGALLRNNLKRLGVDPDRDAYITNSVICFPRVSADDDRFRGPKAEELLACRPRLEEQFSHILQAGTLKGVLLVGKRAYVDFFHREAMEAGRFSQEKDFEAFRVKDVLGWYNGSLPWEGVRVMTVYHPSYLMRQRLLESHPEFVAWKQDLEAFAAWCLQGRFYNPRVS